MASPLLFVPSTFLTVTSLSSFYSLNPCLAIIFLFINIPIALLSKSALTVMPLYVSTFSTLIFNHTSLSILNVLLISLWLASSFAVLFGISVYTLPCCSFSSIGCTATPQFHHGFFFPVLHSGHRISLFSHSNTLFPITSFLYFIYCTLVISPLFSSFSLQFHAFWYRSHHMFFTCLSRRNSCPWFSWV